MSLVDEVLAKHKPEPDSQAEYDNCSGCAGTWPCEYVRLATKLKAAEQVVEAARKVVDTSMRALITCAFCYSVIPQHLDDCPFAELRDSLAEYDQGGQG
jgi:hypothetical protein